MINIGMKSIGPICCVSLSPTHAAPTVQQFYESKDHVNGAYSVNCLSPNHLSPNEANCPCKYPITQSAQLTRTVSLCDTDNFNISMPTTRVHVARYISTPKIINKTVSSQTNLYLSTIAPCEQTCGVKCMQASNCRKDDVF
jgi:hypothetical protein